MAKIIKNTNTLSTDNHSDLVILLAKIKETEEVSANIREKIKKLNQLKSQFNKLSTSLIKLIDNDKLEKLSKSLKKSK